jgi:hypothetical protein
MECRIPLCTLDINDSAPGNPIAEEFMMHFRIIPIKKFKINEKTKSIYCLVNNCARMNDPGIYGPPNRIENGDVVGY